MTSLFSSCPRIEIAGLTASGKTTLATLLRRVGIVAVLEDFHANPFWKPFNADQQAHAFETETTFLLQHYHDIKVALQDEQPFVCDFSPLLDLAYAQVTLSFAEKDVFTSLFEHIQRRLGPPALLVQLRCSPALALERISLRGRVEEQTMSMEYLKSVSSRLEEVLGDAESYKDRLVIDTEHEDFVQNSTTIQRIVRDIQVRLSADTLPPSI
jgi:deoxyadenosine/deoxycytidine kinase